MAQHVYSLDGQRNPVYIESANPQNIYFCPDCNGEMIVKNQGSIREHHFAHKNITDHEGCGESEIHSDTVLFLLQVFRSLLAEGKNLKQVKNCPEPYARGHIKYTKIPYGISTVEPYNKIKAVGDTFTYDILKNVDRVERVFSNSS
ncbi:competence protein CoiA family protein [Methanosarcina siciliae]|uniref:competence protein CoiA family protein n=1 Tax=Methanosarcina siciliae TaxID=38027 RepID=UPI00064EC05C|nr:competence protein CoiA family protein [Methanosarcina siciliae]